MLNFFSHRVFLPAAVVLLSFATSGAAERAGVTPYGDYCSEYSVYGVCKEIILPNEAISALERYYFRKGCSVAITGHRGRFIIADIFRHYTRVDKVIFDTRTGRLRSIY